ncbi:MAG: GAF domain-containing protein [Verrucomicrobia bacterium]|nr:GAF domain-containing protein [Verrucomicrobiota bacterium]
MHQPSPGKDHGQFSELEWRRFLRILADLSGVELSFFDSRWKKLAQTPTVPPVCRLLHHTEEGRRLCHEHCQFAMSSQGDQAVQTFTCHGQMAVMGARVRVGSRLFGFLIGGEARVEGKRHKVSAEARLAQLAKQVGISAEELISAYRRSRGVSMRYLERRRKMFNRLVIALSEMVGDAWLSRVVARVKKCATSDTTHVLWPIVAESVRLLVPAASVEVFSIAPAMDSLASVWPNPPSQLPPPRIADLKPIMKAGFHMNHPSEALLLLGCGEAPLAVLRIHLAEGNQLTVEDIGRLSKLAEGAAETLAAIRARAARQHLEDLELKLCSTDDHYQRLQIILETCVRLLKCETGDVSLVAQDVPGSLRVVGRHGTGAENLPYFVPDDVGITGRVIRTKITAVVPQTSQDPDFQTLTSHASIQSTRYDESYWRRYHDFLSELRSCVKLPVKAGSEILGIICLHRRREGDFDLDAVSTAEAIAARASVEAAAVQASEDLSRHIMPLKADAAALGDLTSRVARSKRADAVHQLCQELADKALKMSGAYRTAVRLLSPDGKTLSVAETAARKPGLWTSEFRDNPVPMDLDCAATWAFRNRETYTIEDTRVKGIHYIPIRPQAGSHASIILKSGVQAFGILNLDWEAPRGFDAVTIKSLEILVDRYATAIKSFGMDELIRKIEDSLKPREKGPFKPDYQEFLRIVAEMVGNQHGALFLRRPETGRYHVVAHLTHPEFANSEFSDRVENSYENGEGLTGWIAKANRPLMIADVKNEDELKAVAEDLAPRDKVYDEPTEDEGNNSYMGVPIAVGGEVLGVLRFAAAGKGRFSSYDQQIALAATSRLAGYLYEEAEQRRTKAFLQLSAHLTVSQSQKELAKSIFETLSSEVGDCVSHIRLLDKFRSTTGEVIPVLRRLTVSHPDWEATPYLRRKGEGIAGRVWIEQRTLVYQDVDHEPWIQDAMNENLQTKDLLAKVGCGACVPITANDEFIGTLHIHKHFRHALSPREITFVEEVSRLAGPALKVKGKREDNDVQIDLEEAVDEFLRNLLQRAPVLEQETRLMKSVLDALRQSFQAAFAWVRTPDELQCQFKAICAHGISVSEVPHVGVADAKSLLGPNLFGVVSEWDHDRRIRAFVTNPTRAYREIVEKSHGCAVLLETENGPLALFSLFVNPPDRVSYSKLERAAGLLRPVAEIILLGRRFEQQLKDLEVTRPLALLGSMFTCVEHEVRSPVSKLKGAIEYLTGPPRKEHEVREMLEIMGHQRNKLQSLIEQMLSMVGLSRTTFAPVDLESCLRNAVEKCQPGAGGPTLRLVNRAGGLMVRGIREYLQSAFQFVVNNAVEAAAARGTAGAATVTVSKPSDGSCVVFIEDNGPGMTESQRCRAFEPFYTTKTTGTGLGLPAAYCIVRSHGGQLTLDPREDIGTRVTITLPLEKEGT